MADMTPAETLRTAAGRLRCEHRFPIDRAGALASCRLCGLPWVDRDNVGKDLREPLAALLTSAARLRGTPEMDAAAQTVARAILGQEQT